MRDKNIQTIFVGVSGGVDSSVAAALLIDEGYEVVGCFIRTWQPEWIECTWRQERRDAMRVCAHLKIPFLECNLSDVYRKNVAQYMIDEYKAGRTPNPDVMCNREVKFGVFLKWALEHGADKIATGHYAQLHILNSDYKKNKLNKPSESSKANKKEDVFVLKKGIDQNKDQTYFLWTLTQEQLSKSLFPIGRYTKPQIRILAEKYLLPTRSKKDSQGVCFLGEIDMKDFLSHYIEMKPGDVLDVKSEIIGSHKHGSLFFTLGERGGFYINPEYKKTNTNALYVISKDIEKNTITVAEKEQLDPQSHQNSEANKNVSPQYKLIQFNNTANLLEVESLYKAHIRYHGKDKEVRILSIDKEDKEVTITFEEVDKTITPGQSVVIYSGEVMVGGGVIK